MAFGAALFGVFRVESLAGGVGDGTGCLAPVQEAGTGPAVHSIAQAVLVAAKLETKV